MSFVLDFKFFFFNLEIWLRLEVTDYQAGIRLGSHT